MKAVSVRVVTVAAAWLTIRFRAFRSKSKKAFRIVQHVLITAVGHFLGSLAVAYLEGFWTSVA